MRAYTVVYIKGTEECARDTYTSGVTVKEIVEELMYNINRYHKHCDYITIFDMNDEADISYFKVVNVDGKYILIELVW